MSPFVPILLTKEPKLLCLLSRFQTSCWTNSGDASESKTHETQIILLLCDFSFSNWWHYCPCVRWNHWSPVDSRCKGSLELNFGGPVCGDSTAGGFPSQKLGLMFFYVCLNKLFNKQYSCQWVEIPGRACDAIVMCHLSIRHSAWLHTRIITLPLYWNWKSNRTYQRQRTPIRPAW